MPSQKEAQTISKLYELYEQSMFYSAKEILHDDYLAEDAVHEAFLRLVRSVKYLGEPESPKTISYVKKVLKSTAIDIYRKNKRDRENCDTIDENEVICYMDEHNEVLPMIDELPDKYKNVLRCIAYHGLSVRETAILLHISEACVRKRYERAKKLFMVKLESNSFTVL